MFLSPRQACSFNRIFQIYGRNKSAQQQSVQDFENHIPKVLEKVLVKFSVPDVTENVKRIVEFSANEENKMRGMIALMAYESLQKPNKITEESLNDIRTLAWGAEMVETYIKMLKDIDESPVNCCWNIQDPSLLRSIIYNMLEHDFMDKNCYVALTKLFKMAILNSTIGYNLDTISKYRRNLENFKLERYNSIVEYSTSYPTFKFPILLAQSFIGESKKGHCKDVDSICSDLGMLYHMKLDFQDCYGAETDHLGVPNHSRQIQEGKCTWLAVTALERLTPEQKLVFSTCYGSKEPAHIERLKLLYDQLRMKEVCKEEQEKICEAIKNNAVKLDEDKSKLIFKILELVNNKA